MDVLGQCSQPTRVRMFRPPTQFYGNTRGQTPQRQLGARPQDREFPERWPDSAVWKFLSSITKLNCQRFFSNFLKRSSPSTSHKDIYTKTSYQNLIIAVTSFSNFHKQPSSKCPDKPAQSPALAPRTHGISRRPVFFTIPNFQRIIF